MDYSIKLDYLNNEGNVIGSQNGLIMSYHDQTVIFSPFNHDKHHFTHQNAICIINDTVINLTKSRLAHPFLLRIWEIECNRINPASELTINFPKKNHSINKMKIENIQDIDINMWHAVLPPILAHQINMNVDIGSITYINNQVTGIIVATMKNMSIIINVYSLKQLINGFDYNYANIYYGIGIKNNIFYIQKDFDQYTNCLLENDILVSINGTKVEKEMYYEKFNKFLYIDTWITCMYMEKENDNLNVHIIREGVEMTIKVPRKPLDHIIQIPYYSENDTKISFELLTINKSIERFRQIGEDLQVHPEKIFV